ncbi:uncharacterized protein LOC115891716 [Sitophilus oryzae]|uniref:Uncharacterized protein LOC115891716 n=1 Tax=Sitophilus oryzae TaxID=7048 RepID=A0A6J2YZ66_SITOR|nr:uncharacterized protein LOC115891716 [Sitophilus oryzae]
MRSVPLKISIFLTVLVHFCSVSNASEFQKSLGKNCEDSYSLSCFKLNAASWVDKLSDNDNIDLIPGVSIVREGKSVKQNEHEITKELAREFPDDPNARVDAFLLKKISGFFDNHAVKLNFWNAAHADSSVSARKKNEGGGGEGLGKLLGLAALMKSGALSIAVAGLAAVAGKALLAGLVALVLAGIALAKGGGGGGSSYEVIAKPVYTSSHSHSASHDGWDGGSYGHKRSFDNAPLPLGLQEGYTPQ